MAQSSQRLRVRHEWTDMACALCRGKQNSHVTASSSDLRICDQLRRKCRVAHCANRKGRGARGSDLSKAKGSVVEWITVQLSVTKVGKWPGAAVLGMSASDDAAGSWTRRFCNRPQPKAVRGQRLCPGGDTAARYR